MCVYVVPVFRWRVFCCVRDCDLGMLSFVVGIVVVSCLVNVLYCVVGVCVVVSLVLLHCRCVAVLLFG